VKPSLLAHGEYAMLSLLPPAREGYLGTPRDVVFVVDRSGSMGGTKMASAARACALLLRTLGPRDRFTVQAFDNVVEWCRAASRRLTRPARRKARSGCARSPPAAAPRSTTPCPKRWRRCATFLRTRAGDRRADRRRGGRRVEPAQALAERAGRRARLHHRNRHRGERRLPQSAWRPSAAGPAPSWSPARVWKKRFRQWAARSARR